MNRWTLALGAATTVGFLLHGPWALAGAVAGLSGAWLGQRLDLPPAALAAAAALPPLVAAGPAAGIVAAVLALVAVSEHAGRVEVLAGAVLGAVLPAPLGVAVPAAAAGLLLAKGRGTTWMFAGVPALASVVASPSQVPITTLACLGAGVVARWVGSHPANATMARRTVQLGIVLLPTPALLGFAFSSIAGEFEPVLGWLGVVALTVAAGFALLVAHLGLALVLRTDSGLRAALLALVWLFPAILLGFSAQDGPRAAMAHGLALLGLTALPVGIGLAASWRALSDASPHFREWLTPQMESVHNKKS